MLSAADVERQAANTAAYGLTQPYQPGNDAHYRRRGINCNERISAGLFCDADCRDDYDKRERFSAMRPRNSE